MEIETNINTTDFTNPKKAENLASSDLPISAKLEREKLRALEINNEIRKENKLIRRCLIIFLSFLTSGWLIFTGYEIRQLAKAHHFLPPSVSIAFITSALATVVSLWAIGLRYFFHTKK